MKQETRVLSVRDSRGRLRSVRLTRREGKGEIEYIVENDRGESYRCALTASGGLHCSCRAGAEGRRCYHKAAIMTAERHYYQQAPQSTTDAPLYYPPFSLLK
jgi:hypothetical protein